MKGTRTKQIGGPVLTWEEKVERRASLWLRILIGSVVLAVLGYGIWMTTLASSNSPVIPKVAAASLPRPDDDADGAEPIEADTSGKEAEARKSIRIPGNLLSDLAEAFEEDESSSLVRLETTEQGLHFERIRSSCGPDHPVEGFTLQRRESGEEDSQLFLVSVGRAAGLIKVARIDSRWCVVDVRPE